MAEDPLVDLSTVYLEIKLKIEEQEDAFANYETSVRNKNNKKRKEYYKKLNKINRDITGLVKDARKLESKIVKKNGKSKKIEIFMKRGQPGPLSRAQSLRGPRWREFHCLAAFLRYNICGS